MTIGDGQSAHTGARVLAAAIAVLADGPGCRCESCRQFLDGACDGLKDGDSRRACYEPITDSPGGLDPDTGDCPDETNNRPAAPPQPGLSMRIHAGVKSGLDASAEPEGGRVPPRPTAPAGQFWASEVLAGVRRRYSAAERALAAAVRGGVAVCALTGAIQLDASRPAAGPAGETPSPRPVGASVSTAGSPGPGHQRHAAAPSTARGGERSGAASLGRSPALGRFFDAVEAIESGGPLTHGVKGGNARAAGDDGASLGPYQISAAYWADGGGKPGSYRRDARRRAPCRAVMIGYFRRYCPAGLARGDWATLAAVHNGGPDGVSKPAARRYAAAVCERMR